MDVNNHLSLPQILNNGFETIRRNAFLNLMFRLSVWIIQVWLSTWAIIWTSIFLYTLFYNYYIPSVLTTKEVFLQYDSICDLKIRNVCKIPFTTVALTQGRTPLLVRGQTYKFSIDMELPESEVNWLQGLFMVRLTLYDQNDNIASDVAKPTGLKYKSYALRAISLLLYWPLFVTGLAQETQHISIDLINNFVEGSHPGVGPTIKALLKFEVRDIQIYPPTFLRIAASLTGLRYYMYHWFITCFLFGTTTLCLFLYIVIAFHRWFTQFQIEDQNNENDFNSDINNDFDNVLNDTNNYEIENIVRNESNRIDDEMGEHFDRELNEIIERNINKPLEQEFNEVNLTGDLSANESESSEVSSTVVIPESEDVDDSPPIPDSSSEGNSNKF